MLTIGVDPHKQTHTAAAVNDLGVEIGHLTAPARPTGNGQLLEWARALDAERVWAVEDVRNVSGSLEPPIRVQPRRVVLLDDEPLVFQGTIRPTALPGGSPG